ncbi:uncharacterized protein LOC135817391 [Sycon ciliatum]|uniref:uncharacterized protein LOC135817391 n=1 Tax=Sycon ciliatum TaxID=27933 RepID=UPI0031F7011C
MDSADDWPKDFQDLKAIDNLLRCPICYEYMEAVVSLRTCLHSFCSVCVRRYLRMYQKDCPQCHQGAVEADVIANRSLGEFVNRFRNVRGRLLSAVRTTSVAGPSSASAVSTEVKRTEQPVASRRPASVKTLRSPEATRAPLPGVRSKIASNRPSDDIPCSYMFSEPWEGAGNAAVQHDGHVDALPEPSDKSDKVQSTASGYQSHDGHNVSVLSDSQEAAAVPEPPMSMPDTQQIVNGYGNFTAGSSHIHRDVAAVTSVVSDAPLVVSSSESAVSSASTVDVVCAVPAPGGPDSSERVKCPVCAVLVPSRSVNSHLDRCLSHEGHKPKLTLVPASTALTLSLPAPAPMSTGPVIISDSKPAAASSAAAAIHKTTASSTSTTTAVSRKSMPRLVYTLLSDKQLRKHLRDCSLPTHGSKQAMVKRHQEFVLRYNAEADSSNPRSGVEIAKAIDEEERARAAGSAPLSRGVTSMSQRPLRFESNQSVDEKNKLRQEYAQHHQGHFDHLIDEVRQRRQGGTGAAAAPVGPVAEAITPSRNASRSPAQRVRSSPRHGKARPSPRVQLPAKRRQRSTRKKTLALSDEEEAPMASSTDTDVDPQDFLQTGYSSQNRRSTRRRAVRQSYIEAPSSDDDNVRRLDDNAADKQTTHLEESEVTVQDLVSDNAGIGRGGRKNKRKRSGNQSFTKQVISDDDFEQTRSGSSHEFDSTLSSPQLKKRRSTRSKHAPSAVSPLTHESRGALCQEMQSRAFMMESDSDGVCAENEQQSAAKTGCSKTERQCNDIGSPTPAGVVQLQQRQHKHHRRQQQDDGSECTASDATAEYTCSEVEEEYTGVPITTNTSATHGGIDDSGEDGQDLGSGSARAMDCTWETQCNSMPVLESATGSATGTVLDSTACNGADVRNSSAQGNTLDQESGAVDEFSQCDSQPLLAAATAASESGCAASTTSNTSVSDVDQGVFFGNAVQPPLLPPQSLINGVDADDCAQASFDDDNAETQFPGASTPDSSGVFVTAPAPRTSADISPQILAEETQMDYSPPQKPTSRVSTTSMLHSPNGTALHATCIEETQGFSSPEKPPPIPPAAAVAASGRSLRSRR